MIKRLKMNKKRYFLSLYSKYNLQERRLYNKNNKKKILVSNNNKILIHLHLKLS